MVRPSHARAAGPCGASVMHGAGVTGVTSLRIGIRRGVMWWWWWPVGRSGSEQVEGAGRVPVGRWCGRCCSAGARRPGRGSPSAASPGTGEVVPGVERLEAGAQVLVGRGAAGVGDAVSVVVGDGGRPDSEESGDHLLRRVGEALLGLLEVGVPDRAVPDLEARTGTDDRDLAVEARVLAQVGRDREPALLVGDLVGRAGEE